MDTYPGYMCGPCNEGYVGNGVVCSPNGTVNIATSSQFIQATVGSAVTVTVTSLGAAASSVSLNVTGLDPSRFQITSALTLSFTPKNPSANFTLSLLASQSILPAIAFTIQLTNAQGGAVLGPAAVAIVSVEAYNAVTGEIGFFNSVGPTLPDLTSSINVPVVRSVPSGDVSGLLAVDVSFSTNSSLAPAGVVSFAAGAAVANATVVVNKGAEPGLGFYILVTLVSDANITLGFNANITFFVADYNNAHGLLSITPSVQSVAVGTAGSVTIARGAGAFGAVSALLRVVPGTAQSSQYTYNKAALQLAWSDGNSAPITFSFNVIDDGVPKLAEWFTIQILSTGTTGDVAVNSALQVANITIPANNNPHGVIALETSTNITVESKSIAYLAAIRSAGTFGLVTVNYAITGPAAAVAGFGSSAMGVFTFPPGVSTSTVKIYYQHQGPPLDVSFVTLSISNPTGGAVLDSDPNSLEQAVELTDYAANPSGVFAVVVDPQFEAIVSQPVPYGSNFSVDVVRTGSAFDEVELSLSPTAAQRARIKLLEYPTYKLTFAPGQGIQTLTVLVQDDGQPHNASVIILNLGLVSVNGGQVLGAALNGTANTIAFTLPPVNSPKGIFVIDSASQLITTSLGQQSIITLRRTFGSAGAFNVLYAISAQPLQVLDLNSGVASFSDGQATATITLQSIDSGFPVLNQSFSVTLDSVVALDVMNPVNTTGPFIGGQSVALINVPPAHDPFGRFAFASPTSLTVTKNVGTFAVNVLRTAGELGAVNVNFVLLGTAVQGVDYTITPSNGVLSFAASQAMGTFKVVFNGCCIRIYFTDTLPSDLSHPQCSAQRRSHHHHTAHKHHPSNCPVRWHCDPH